MPLNETKAQIFGNNKPKPKPSATKTHLANQTRERSRNREEGSRSSSHSSGRQPIHPPAAYAASTLKVPVPNTLPPNRPTGLKHQTSQSTLDDQENGAAFKPPIKQELRSERINQMHGGNDEDITDLTFGDSGWDSEGSYCGEATARRMPVAGNEQKTIADSLGPGWRAEADAERMRQGHRPVYTIGSIPRRGFNLGQSKDDTYSGIGDDDGEDDYEESVQNLENKTPSRTTMLPIGKPGAQDQTKKQVRIASNTLRDATLPSRGERHSSPLPERDEPMSAALQQPQMHHNSILRHNQYKQHVDSIPPPEPFCEPALAPALKVFSYQEVSEDEQIPERTPQSTTTAIKRRHAEIDYDPEDLKGKSYVDLEQLPFITDPRAPQPLPAVDVNGTALSLPQRLTNLNKMRSEDQSALFHSLTDEENGEAGQWFVQNFQDELQKLMERRLERRKIALKYEMEVKKRETVVKVKTGDVDDELKELRKGGGLLIEGKSVERIGGTPKAK